MNTPDWVAPAFLDALPPDVRLQMLRLYRDGLRDQAGRLEPVLESVGALQAAASIAHKIAGSAGMMQDQALAQAARQLEDRLREGAPEAHGQVQDLLELVRRTLGAIERAIG